MTHDTAEHSEAAPEPRQPWIAELIPGEDVFILLDPACGIPDDDAIEEMRIQAHERRDTPVMGTTAVEAVQTLAGWAASGVVGNIAFAPFPATWAYLQRWRDRRPSRKMSLEQAIEVAVSLLPSALRSEPEHCEVLESQAIDDGWQILMLVDLVEYEFMIDSSGSVASFEKITGRRRQRRAR